jgi:hypothetical protein
LGEFSRKRHPALVTATIRDTPARVDICDMGYTDRASYTMVDADRWLVMRPEARNALIAAHGKAVSSRSTMSTGEAGIADQAVIQVLELCMHRYVLPVLGDRLVIPGRLIPGWGRPEVYTSPAARHEAIQREYHPNKGWWASVGGLDVRVACDGEDRRDESMVMAIMHTLGYRPQLVAGVLARMKPLCILSPERMAQHHLDRAVSL